MKIFTDDIGTKELIFGDRSQHVVIWSSKRLETVSFIIKSAEASAYIALSIDGLIVVLNGENTSATFSNPSNHVMEQATVPKRIADVLCEEIGLQYETND